MYGVLYLKRFMALEESVSNMRTDGILRLLSGESFSMCDEDMQILTASPQWATLAENHHHDPLLQGYCTFAPITVNADDIFLWSPFADCLVGFTKARCGDHTMFPCAKWPINEVFEHLPRTPFVTVEALWHRMAHMLNHVQKKAVILYPPDVLASQSIGDQAALDTVEHILFYNRKADSVFSKYGWKVFSPEPRLNEDDPYWAHYADDAKIALWNMIEWELSIHASSRLDLLMDT